MLSLGRIGWRITESSLIMIVGGLLLTHKMMLVLCFKGISTMLCPKPCKILGGIDSCRVGWQTLPWRMR